MKLRSLITPEMYQAIRDLPNVTITPYTPRVRKVPMGSMRKMGIPDLTPYVGDVGRVGLGGFPPSTSVVGIANVCEQARTFGIRSNI